MQRLNRHHSAQLNKGQRVFMAKDDKAQESNIDQQIWNDANGTMSLAEIAEKYAVTVEFVQATVDAVNAARAEKDKGKNAK